MSSSEKGPSETDFFQGTPILKSQWEDLAQVALVLQEMEANDAPLDDSQHAFLRTFYRTGSTIMAHLEMKLKREGRLDPDENVYLGVHNLIQRFGEHGGREARLAAKQVRGETSEEEDAELAVSLTRYGLHGIDLKNRFPIK